MPSKIAKIELVANKAPILTAGMISPETLRRFENACRNYFRIKKIPLEEQVASIAGNMQDELVSDWYWTDEKCINALSFEDFMKEMCTKWLQKGWEQNIRRRVLGTKQGNDPFWDWAVHVCSLNALLRDLTSHLADNVLCNQLEANLETNLSIACDDDGVSMETDLEKWMGLVKQIDERKHRECVQAKADAEEAACNSTKRPFVMTGILEPSRRTNAPLQPRPGNTSNSSNNVSSKPARITLP